MKKNAVLIAGIMFVAAGCASSEGQRASRAPIYDYPPSTYNRADVSVASTDLSVDGASGAPGSTVSQSYSDAVSADSSKRGGSLDARGYHQDANNDEVESAPDPINPSKQADSSIRGGSVFARDRELKDDSEPSVGQLESDRRIKANSSVRGGSVEARGAREAHGESEAASDIKTIDVDVDANSELRSSSESPSRDDFGQGSSATWESDKANGSVRGSANWNASDDLLRDGVKSDSSSTSGFEFNSDASVGGAASGESGSDSSGLDLEGSSNASERSADIHHDESDLTSEGEAETGSSELKSNGAGEFESNDPAMKKPGSPLGTAGGEPNFYYQDNRAHGIGAGASGEFATAPVNQKIDIRGEGDLAEQVKGTLTRESAGIHGLMRREVARNVQVSAEGGEVTIRGTVPSQKDKEMIEIRTREIAGVERVNNQLSVTPEAEAAQRSDPQK